MIKVKLRGCRKLANFKGCANFFALLGILWLGLVLISSFGQSLPRSFPALNNLQKQNNANYFADRADKLRDEFAAQRKAKNICLIVESKYLAEQTLMLDSTYKIAQEIVLDADEKISAWSEANGLMPVCQ